MPARDLIKKILSGTNQKILTDFGEEHGPHGRSYKLIRLKPRSIFRISAGYQQLELIRGGDRFDRRYADSQNGTNNRLQ